MFIVLTTSKGIKIRQNVSNIINYFQVNSDYKGHEVSGKGSHLRSSDSTVAFWVEESPEEIDKMLEECYITIKHGEHRN